MAQQIKKKFIGNDQVDGDKILLEQSQSIRAKDSSDQEVDLISLGASDEVLVKGEEVALKSDIEAVEDRLDIIEGADTVEGSIAKAEKDAKEYADQKIADLVDSAPELLDTLNELAAALGDDPNFSTTVLNSIGAVEDDVSKLVTLSGMPVDSQHLGEFTGTTIPDSQTIKQALQALEIAVESVSGGGSSTQTELDATQVGAGLDTDGSYIQPSTSNYLNSTSSLADADMALDAQIKIVADALAQEITDRESADSGLQDEIDATQQGAGLEVDGSYVAPVGSNYLGSATSLKDADSELDSQIKVNADAIADVASDLALHISQEIGAHEASAISVVAIEDVAGSDVQAVLEDLKSQIDNHLNDTEDAHNASSIYVSPVGNLAASDTQAALEELQGDIDAINQELNGLSFSAEAISFAPAGNIQAVNVQDAIEELDSGVVEEASLRTAADSALQSAIDSEASARIAGDSALQSAIDDEASARIAGDSSLQSQIDSLSDQVGDDLQDAISSLQSAVTAEESARIAADSSLQSQIDNIISNTDPAVLDSLSEIVEAFQSADGNLNQLITDLGTSSASSLQAEIDRASGEEARIEFKVDQEILDRQSAISAETSAREAADSSLQSQIDNLSDQVGENLQDAISGLQSAVDSEASARIAGDSLLSDRIDVLEATKEIIEVESIGEAPALGLEGKVYVAKDSNKLYRWEIVGGGELSFDLVVGEGEAYATLQDAIAVASNGQNILVKAGTYLVSSVISVNKELKIVGEDADTVIFETAASTSAPVSMFNVSANNVALAKMTIKHKKTSNTSVESAVVASGGGFPQTRITNFIMEQCKIEFVEFGLVVRAQDWCVRDSQFTYATGAVSNSCRAIGIYGNKGNSFIKDNFLKNDVLNGTAFRPFYLTSTTGTNPNETVEGKLVIEGTTHVGPLAQFWNQDNQQGAVGAFELVIKDNVTNESNLFAAFFSAAANAGDMFSSITLSGNTISNLHAIDGGKGLYGIAGTAAFRTSPLIVHASNNTIGQEVYRAGWEAVSGSLIGKETAVPAFTVALDSVIPESGEAPSAITVEATGSYVELSPEADLSEIESRIDALEASGSGNTFYKMKIVIDSELSYVDLNHEAIENSIVASVARLMIHKDEDFTVSIVGGVSRLTFINSLANPAGEEKIESGDIIFVTYAVTV